jgi:hypothetical protein
LLDIAFSHARKVEAQPLVLKTFAEHSADLTRYNWEKIKRKY